MKSATPTCLYPSLPSQQKSPFFLFPVLFLSHAPALSLCHGCLQSCFFQHLRIWATVEGSGRRVVFGADDSRCHDEDYRDQAALDPLWVQIHCWPLK